MIYNYNKLKKMQYTNIQYTQIICYNLYNLHCKIKYFIYFTILLNSVAINYLYYKIFSCTNNNLIVLLNHSINLNGCIIIKFIQWINNHLQFLKNDNVKNEFIEKLFSKYYENCSIHALKYTKNMFFQEFGYVFDDIFVLDETFKIKSGSIAQVYKGYIKKTFVSDKGNHIISEGFEDDCSKETSTKEKSLTKSYAIAIKVVHPEIKYQMIYPIYFVKMYKFFVTNFICLKKYDTIFNFDSFFDNLKKQINMVNEYNNNEHFYNKYKNDNIIVIPKPLFKSNNFLIMEYIEGEHFENVDITDYKKQIIISFISMFIKDNYMFGKYVHCDLHDANWKVLKPQEFNSDGLNSQIYKIVIYDFGYVLENDLGETIQKLIYYLDMNNIYELGKIMFDIICISDFPNETELKSYKEEFIDNFVKYNERCYPYTDNNLIACYNFCYSNGYKLKKNILDFFISMMLLQKYFKIYIFSNFEDVNHAFNDANYYKYIYSINSFYVSICEKYDVFKHVKDHINERYILNPFFIEKIKYSNNYFDSLNTNRDFDTNMDFDI